MEEKCPGRRECRQGNGKKPSGKWGRVDRSSGSVEKRGGGKDAGQQLEDEGGISPCHGYRTLGRV